MRVNDHRFYYRAMLLHRAVLPQYLCPSVRLSGATLVDCDHVSWAT